MVLKVGTDDCGNTHQPLTRIRDNTAHECWEYPSTCAPHKREAKMNQQVELGGIWLAIAVLIVLQVVVLTELYRTPGDAPSRLEVIQSNNRIEMRLEAIEATRGE